MQGSKETKTLPYRPGPLSGFVKLNAADAGGRGPDCPAPNRDRTGHVWRRGLPHSLARAGKRGLPHVCCRTATATRSTAFGSRTPCRVVRAEPIRRAKSSLVEYPEDEGADYGTLSIAVAVGHSAADPGADLDLRRPALGHCPSRLLTLRRPGRTTGRRFGIMSTLACPVVSLLHCTAARVLLLARCLRRMT